MADSHPPSDADAGAAAMNVSSLENLGTCSGSKRQRRPSVRLGGIGEQSAAASSYDPYIRRCKQWKISATTLPAPAAGKALSMTRPLTHLRNGESHEILEAGDKNLFRDLESASIGSRMRDLKSKRGFMASATKRVRSNWVLSTEYDAEGGSGSGSGVDEKFSGGSGGGDDGEEGFRDFDQEGSEIPLKGDNPNHSMETLAVDLLQLPAKTQSRGGGGVRDLDAVELDEPSDTNGQDWKCGSAGVERNVVSERRHRSLDHTVRLWLNGLGLGRYAALFEFHEVDEEVLPWLTLDDLKDMGINAVGSRRKMYCGIQKLGKGFSLEFG